MKIVVLYLLKKQIKYLYLFLKNTYTFWGPILSLLHPPNTPKNLTRS